MQLNAVDQAFHSTYKQLLVQGHLKSNRTGVDTLMLPAMMMKFDLRGKKNPWPSTKELRSQKLGEEMEWFISGSSSIKFLRDRKNGIWDDWFMPGTAVYDEPVLRDLTTQERVILACYKGLGDKMAAAIKGRLASSGVGGSKTLTVPLNARESLTFSDLPAIDKYIDTLGIPRTVALWPATDPKNRLTVDERMSVAAELGLIEGVTPLNSDHYPAEMILDLLGVRERRDVVMPVSLKKRLTRVSKNDSEKWDAINRVIDEDWEKLRGNWVGEAILDAEGTQDYVVFREGRFQTVSLIPLVAACVNQRLNTLGVPAYPLLDADIGPGGYGPQWRHWQDTQIVRRDDRQKYLDQGYEEAGQLTNDSNWGRGDVRGVTTHHVMHREVDQLQACIDKLRTNPDDRRMLVTAWNPGLLWQAALPPCHLYFQFMTSYRTGKEVYDDLLAERNLWNDFTSNYYEDEQILLNPETFIAQFDNTDDVAFREYTEAMLNAKHFRVPTRHLHCLLVMRSSDTPLGTPFNVAQYALLVHVVAHVTNMEAASLTWVGGDSHIYVNQIDAITTQLSRESMPDCDVRIHFERDLKEIDDFTLDAVSFSGYSHRGFLDIPVAV